MSCFCFFFYIKNEDFVYHDGQTLNKDSIFLITVPILKVVLSNSILVTDYIDKLIDLMENAEKRTELNRNKRTKFTQ